jgi:hypothetical protein
MDKTAFPIILEKTPLGWATLGTGATFVIHELRHSRSEKEMDRESEPTSSEE